jgi:SpoVK/Ycf46/Vps4 family AAA+-type ATPase
MLLRVTILGFWALSTTAGSAPERDAIAPRLRELAQTCQAERGISSDAFRSFLRNPERAHVGWTVVLSDASAAARHLQAKKVGVAARAEVYRVNLDDVIGKYIGETEKNLTRVLDKARDDGVILFFDEADALFGKRTNVRDAHDRYANQDIAYLLQEIAKHPDLVIVGTSRSMERLTPAAKRWADTLVTTRPGQHDEPLPWHRLCWPPREDAPRR